MSGLFNTIDRGVEDDRLSRACADHYAALVHRDVYRGRRKFVKAWRRYKRICTASIRADLASGRVQF